MFQLDRQQSAFVRAEDAASDPVRHGVVELNHRCRESDCRIIAEENDAGSIHGASIDTA